MVYTLRILNYLLCCPAANRRIQENGKRAHFRKIKQEKPVQYIAAELKLIFMGENNRDNNENSQLYMTKCHI
jgi:hypothetical protein